MEISGPIVFMKTTDCRKEYFGKHYLQIAMFALNKQFVPIISLFTKINISIQKRFLINKVV